MSMPQPPQIAAAFSQLEAVLEQVENKKVDLTATGWPQVEKSVIKVLGGPFQIEKPDHQMVALGLAAAFASRLADTGAFWFPSREAAEGAALGFPEALITLSPFGAVMDALGNADLSKLGAIEKDVRTSLAQVKFSATSGGAPMRLGPEEYMRLFDPGFVQVVAVDGAVAKETWAKAPDVLARDVKDAVGRAAKLPEDLRKQLEQQLVTSLARMKAGTPLIQQVRSGPRVAELIGVLFGSTLATGSAPEEFWSDVAVPLLFIGAPEKFPEVDGEELEVAKQGIDPLFLFLEAVPYQFKAPDEEGLLGAFAASGLALPDPGFQQISNLRLIKVNVEAIKEPLLAFDEAKTRDALQRFGKQLAAQVGDVTRQGTDEAKQMLDSALVLLGDLKRVVAEGKDVYVRRLTEAEAASEPALALVRQALKAPRIILTA